MNGAPNGQQGNGDNSSFFHQSQSIVRFLSPQNRSPTMQSQSSVVPAVRETVNPSVARESFYNQGRESFISNYGGGQREHVIPVGTCKGMGNVNNKIIEYLVTKKVEQQNVSDYEVRIQTLIHEVELWRKRYLELMALHDKSVAQEEIIQALETRTVLLTEEYEKLNQQLKERISENDSLRLEMQNMELEMAGTRQLQMQVQTLEKQLKVRTEELEDSRRRFGELETQFSEMKTVEISLLEYEGRIRGWQGENQLWHECYDQVCQEKNQLLDELKNLYDKMSGLNLDQAQRLSLSQLKLFEIENAKLKGQLAGSQKDVEKWRRRAMDLEQELDNKNHAIEDFKRKATKLNAEIDRQNTTIVSKNREIERINAEVDQIMIQMQELEQLKVHIQNLDSVINTKAQDNEKLRKDINRLEGTISQLRHEQVLRLELESKLGTTTRELQKFKETATQKQIELDQWKVKYGQLEVRNTELLQQVSAVEELERQVLFLKNDLNSVQASLKFKDDSINGLERELTESQNRIKQLKLLEVDLRRLSNDLNARDNDVDETRKLLTKQELQELSKRNLEDKIQELEKQKQKLSSQLQKTTEELGIKNQEIGKVYADNSRLDAQVNQLLFIEQQLNGIRQERDSAVKEAQAHKLKANKADNEISTLKQYKEASQVNLAFLNSEIQRLQKIIDQRKQEVQEWRQKAGKWEVEANELKKYNTELNDRSKQLQNELEQATKQVKDLQKESEKVKNQLQRAELDLQAKDRSFQTELLQRRSELDKQVLTTQQKQKEADEWKQRYMKSEQLNHDLKGIEDKFNQADAKVNALTKENQRLNDLIKNRNDNQEQIRQRMGQLEVQVQLLEGVEQENGRLRERLEESSKQVVSLSGQVARLQQELNDAQRRVDSLEERCERLMSDLQRVNQVHQVKVQESEEQRNRCNALESTVIELRSLERRLPQLDARINTLDYENSKLLGQLRQTSQECEKAKSQQQKLLIELESMVMLQNENANLKSRYQQKCTEVDQERQRMTRLQIDIEQTSRQRDEIDGKYEQVVGDLDRVNKQLQGRLRESEQLQIKWQRAELQLNENMKHGERARELDSQVKLGRIESQKLKEELKNLRDQVSNLKCALNKKEMQIGQLCPLKGENERLKELNERDQVSIKDLMKKYVEAQEVREREGQELMTQKAQLQNEVDILKNDSVKVQELENVLAQLDTQLRAFVNQINGLQDDNLDLKYQVQNLELKGKQYESIEKEYRQLRDLYDQQLSIIDQLKISLSKKEAEAANFQNFKDSLESRVALLASEIERLSHMIKTKNDDIENLNYQLQRLSPLEGDNRRIGESMGQLKAELDQWKQNYEKVRGEAEEAKSAREGLENRLALLSSEIERLQMKCNNRIAENDQLKAQLLELEQVVPQISKLEGIIGEVEQKDLNNRKEIDRLQRDLNQKSQENLNFKQKINELDSYIQSLKQLELEVQKLQGQIQTQGKENQEWLKKNDFMQQQIDKLEQIKMDYEGKIAMLSSEIERLNKKYEVAQRETSQLKEQINMLNQEIDRLNQLVKGLTQEADSLRQRQSTMMETSMNNSSISQRRQTATTLFRQQ